MQDKIVRRMHDLLGSGLELKERLERGDVPAFEPEYERLRALVLGDGELAQTPAYNGDLAAFAARPDAGADALAQGDLFLGARYALTCWLDEIFILHSPEWWSARWEANTMEAALYGGTQQRAWRFWDQALKAEGPRGSSEALEAYLWSVMLGFRGSPPEGLNPATWVGTVKQRVMTGRSTEFPAPPEKDLPVGVPPLRGRERFARMLRVAVVAGAGAAFAAGLLAVRRLGS
jgi:hypothetical protein